MTRFGLLTLAVLTGAGPAVAQTRPDSSLDLTRRFPVGETLVYDARFGILTLGEGLMHVAGIDTIRGAPSLHVVFRLRGGSFFYRLDDRMDSWIGIDDFASRRFIQDFREGNSERYTAYEIFPDSGYYSQNGTDSVFPTSAAPLDDAAFFYFVRTVPLEVGERYEFERYFRPDRNPVVLEVLGRDTLDLPAGRFPTIVVRPVIQGRGILEEAKEPRMWLTDDARRLMVQLKLKFASIATITLRLREIRDTPPADLARR
ncbi:MAG: DUF3108 domain-containing protein [Gemmatimonadota bacterium]|nr:DUF3108 domain-containing protein [Gemmatimonadota bacterium]